MIEYTLSAETARLLKLHNKMTSGNISVASPSEIQSYNRAEIKKKHLFKTLYKPVSKNQLLETFIIPVTNGNVTGYLFRKSSTNTNNGPLIIFFHEGGWMLGNMQFCNAICSKICDETDSTVLAIDYRRSPQFKFPIPVEDCYSAFIWASQGARYWKTDPSRIFLMGSCSGANLAIAVARLARDRKGPQIAGLILEDPITDARLKTDSIEIHKNNPVIPKRDLEFFIQNYQREPKDILDPLFSPLLGLDQSRLPQTLIFSSELSPLSDDAKLYEQALHGADSPVKVIELPGRLHCTSKYPDSERWSDEMDTVKSFLQGKAVANLQLLTKRERRKLNRKKAKVVAPDYSQSKDQQIPY